MKCDEARPSCLQCRIGRRTCPGYARGLKFVDEGPRVRRSKRAANRVTRSEQPPSREESTVSPTLDGKCDTVSSVCDRGPQNQWNTRFCHFASSALERHQILSSFISAMFPLGAASVQRTLVGSWLWHVPSRLDHVAVLDNAALSLSLGYFARVSGDQRVLCRAQMSYTRALKNLAADVADRSKGYSSEVLCAALLLGLYEVRTLRRSGRCAPVV